MDAEQRRQQYLKAMGIPVWISRAPAGLSESRESAGLSPATNFAAISESPVAPRAIANMDWTVLQQTVATCTACDLHRTRTQTVFGVGNRQAEWLIIGEAPGADEDRQGEPFVGRAGQLLNEMLKAIGLRREAVYIANILKCRPPNNRDPRPEEVVHCERYLQRQIEMIQPKLILAVGRIAAQNLLKTDQPLTRLRGRLQHYGVSRIPVVITYHPAYLLRSPLEKRKAWQDLQFALAVSRGEVR